MRTKSVLFALAPVVLVLQVGSAWAESQRPLPVRWEGTLESQTTKLVVYNLSARPAGAFLGSKRFAIPANGGTEIAVTGLGTEPLRLRSDAHLLVLETWDDFEADSLEIEKSVSRAAGKLLPQIAGRPDWEAELTSGGPSVRHGAAGTATVRSEDLATRIEVAVELLAPHTSVLIRQIDATGNEMTALTASASRPVRWRASLGPVNGESRIELRTLRGEAQATAAAVVEGGSPARRSPVMPFAKSGGLALFSPDINWENSGNLTYNISGAPASLCGDLYISRNFGAYTVTSNWVCADASGNATKGPWTWAGQSGTEFASAYILWSNGLSTNTDQHIWDKTPPTAAITSAGGSPSPGSFSGTGSDVGAGFSSSWGSSCSAYFYNSTTDDYWDPSSNQYINAFFPVHVSCTISGMPSTSVT